MLLGSIQLGCKIAWISGTATGIELADLSIQKPTLESVFLKLTGRELRD